MSHDHHDHHDIDTADYHGPDRRQFRHERWHVGKEIPIAVVVLIVMQAVGTVWYMSAKADQIEHNRQEIVKIEHTQGTQSALSTRVTRLEAMQQAELATLQDIQESVRDLRDYLLKNERGERK